VFAKKLNFRLLGNLADHSAVVAIGWDCSRKVGPC